MTSIEFMKKLRLEKLRKSSWIHKLFTKNKESGRKKEWKYLAPRGEMVSYYWLFLFLSVLHNTIYFLLRLQNTIQTRKTGKNRTFSKKSRSSEGLERPISKEETLIQHSFQNLVEPFLLFLRRVIQNGITLASRDLVWVNDRKQNKNLTMQQSGEQVNSYSPVAKKLPSCFDMEGAYKTRVAFACICVTSERTKVEVLYLESQNLSYIGKTYLRM